MSVRMQFRNTVKSLQDSMHFLQVFAMFPFETNFALVITGFLR